MGELYVSQKMKIFVLLLLLIFQIEGLAQIKDPFGGGDGEVSKWPSSLAPSKEELKYFGEVPLTTPAVKGAVDIRFIWVPTFHKPILIRATKVGDQMSLTVVQMSGGGGYDWGKVNLKKSIKLSGEQWRGLSKLIAVDGARKPSAKLNKVFRDNFIETMSGLDGSIWFLEVRDQAGYTVEGVPNPVDKNAKSIVIPKKEGDLDLKPFVDVCIKLFDLSGLKESPDY